MLSLARFFLFGARDIWFVVGVPVFLYDALDWSFSPVGAFMAFWVIGCGIIPSAAPNILRVGFGGRPPAGRSAMTTALVLGTATAAATLPLLLRAGPSASGSGEGCRAARHARAGLRFPLRKSAPGMRPIFASDTVFGVARGNLCGLAGLEVRRVVSGREIARNRRGSATSIFVHPMNNKNAERCIAACNNLLRGEISAIETYNQAIAKFRDEAEVSLLEDIRSEHVSSANRLRENVRNLGGEPVHDSGVWGTWARAVEGAARLIGNAAALKALQEGEEHGEKEYEEALESDDVMPDSKEIIRTELLPRQLRHTSTIRGLVHAQ